MLSYLQQTLNQCGPKVNTAGDFIDWWVGTKTYSAALVLVQEEKVSFSVCYEFFTRRRYAKAALLSLLLLKCVYNKYKKGYY